MAGWYYRQLDRSGREVYDGMRAGFAALAPAIRLPRLEGERLSEIYLRLKLDEPLLFHVTGFKYRFDPRGDHIELIPEYLFDKGKIRTHRRGWSGWRGRCAERASLSASRRFTTSYWRTSAMTSSKRAIRTRSSGR